MRQSVMSYEVDLGAGTAGPNQPLQLLLKLSSYSIISTPQIQLEASSIGFFF